MENAIREIIRTSVKSFAEEFELRHMLEVKNPEGVINKKVHNIFVAALGAEIQFYSALSRSLDSSLGNLMEAIAVSIAELNFDVSRRVEGVLYAQQIEKIGALLERYKNAADELKPEIAHYLDFGSVAEGSKHSKRHESDYVLKNRTDGKHHIIELKLGGDLDNKKARSEKEALLEQYCILVNSLGSSEGVSIHFATGYNRFGEGNPWTQGRVLQFFAKDELLISRDFWNFVCDRDDGMEIVLDEYKKCAGLISAAIKKIRGAYLPNNS
jgi:Type II restriction endonuclease, TdeIII